MSMLKVVTPTAPMARRIAPNTTTPRTPLRSNRRPAIRPDTAPKTAPGSMSRPDTVAVLPMTCWT